jgi:hypothetical protein
MSSQQTAVKRSFIVRQKATAYLWLIVPSTVDTEFVDRKGFGIDNQYDCRGQILHVMMIDGVTCCIGRLAIGQRTFVKHADGTPVLREDGKPKYTYQPSNEWKWGSIHYYPPSQKGCVIPGHIDLRDYFADDGSITGKDLYELVGDIVFYYNEAKQNPPVHSVTNQDNIQPLRLIQPTPLFTAQDYYAWKQYQAFLQWQQMNMQIQGVPRQ